VTADRAARRQLALAAVLVLPSAILCAAATWVGSRYRMEPPAPLSAEARAAAMATLRATLDGRPAGRPRHAELERELADGGPVLVSVWHQGERAARVEGRGARAADALAAAARALAEAPGLAELSAADRKAARIQVDLVTARAPLLTGVAALELFGLQAGREGLGAVTAGPEEHFLLPDELVQARLLVSQRPVRSIPDLRVGVDVEKAGDRMAKVERITSRAWDQLDRTYFRFRTLSFVEPPGGGAPLPLERGLPPGPELNAQSLRSAAIEGGHYLVRHLAPNGRYIYETDLSSGRASDPNRPRPYSLPRHAGTTYFLAELYRLTGEKFLLEPIERAFGHFADLVQQGGCSGTTPGGARFACVHQKGDRRASLGSTALAVVALAEYRRATKSTRFDALTRQLAEWILTMQRPDGTFAHLYDVARGQRDEKTQMLYYSGEAALALARMHAVYGEERYLRAAERALDRLVDWYDFFAGGFFYGEEHWTCIAAEAAWPALRHDRYREFCDGYGDFLRRQQMLEDDFSSDQADLDGTFGVTPFLVPNNTPVGSRNEAMISSYLLGQYHGLPSEPMRQQILRSMRYALRQQVRAEGDFWVKAGTGGRGAITASPIDPVVRIDYVQHVCSALIRAVPLLSPPRAK
jgi:hypothetical protein